MTHASAGGARRLLLAAGLGALSLALAGCGTSVLGGGGSGAVSTAAAAAEDGEGQWRGREGVREAIALMNAGDGAGARRRLASVLRHSPDDGIARQLLAQIDEDPRALLGEESYSHSLREGESLSSVAQDALGNPMLFYALARYNGIPVPSEVGPGQTILVPGRRPAAAARPAPQRARPEAAPQRQARRETPAPQSPSVSPPAAQPPRPAANPARAAQLRGQGLAALNAGAVDRAVGLLRQAQALDPANQTIRNDLGRALRIQGTVRGR